MYNKLSIIIPCFNEEKYVTRVLNRVFEVQLTNNLHREVIIVDDGSTDSTYSLIDSFCSLHPARPVTVIRHEVNKGKGACIKSGLTKIQGDVLVIQDADLEYNPEDYNLLLEPIINEKADAVFGSRFKGNGVHKGPFILHKLVNKSFTYFINIITGHHFTDIHTCYKMFKTGVLKDIEIEEQRFGVDPEMVVKLCKKKDIRICEVGISYYGRTFAEGKKISWYDGWRALYCIIKYNFFSRNSF